MPIILALALNYTGRAWFRRTVQMVGYAPFFISIVVMVGIILVMLDPRFGIVNQFLGLVGLGPVDFMGNAGYFRHVYVWSGVWQYVGFSCIIYLAALTSVDPTLHEAAIIDGANKLQRIRDIDLPASCRWPWCCSSWRWARSSASDSRRCCCCRTPSTCPSPK